MEHTYDYDAMRCMSCDCRPWGIHSGHPCTGWKSCEEFHGKDDDNGTN